MSSYERNATTKTRYVGSVDGMTTTTFAERLDQLIQAAGGASKLSKASGLSAGYCATLKTRMREDPGARPDDKSLEALARGGHVSYDWLKRGAGDMSRAEEGDPPPPASEEPFADAIAAAFDGQRHTLADLDAARQVASETYRHLRPEADTKAIAATWLDAAAALRRRGHETSSRAVLAHLSELAVGAHALSDVEAATNAEVDARLRAKGMEPGQGAAVIEKLRKK